MDDALLAREANHRCNNDLQMVIGLLRVSAERTQNAEAREALKDTANRVGAVAIARAGLLHPERYELSETLHRIVRALAVLAAPREVGVSLEISGELPKLTDGATRAVALSLNELATNAIKHAFDETCPDKNVHITAGTSPDGSLHLSIEDDGVPLPDPGTTTGRSGSMIGLDLVRRMISAQGGVFLVPDDDDKLFEIIMPGAEQLVQHVEEPMMIRAMA